MAKRPTPLLSRRLAENDHREREKILDKMHCERMVNACMGVLMQFAFSDEQGQRAACLLLAETAKQMGTTKEALIERVSLALEVVNQAPESKLLDQ